MWSYGVCEGKYGENQLGEIRLAQIVNILLLRIAETYLLFPYKNHVEYILYYVQI